jgi:glucose-1-phosphatase
MIGHLVVDLGGVATGFHPQRRLQALTQATGMSSTLIHQRLFASGLDHDAELGHIELGELVPQVIAALNDTISVEQLIQCWAQAFEPQLEVLAAVRYSGAKRTLLTNNGPLISVCLDGPLREIADCFDEVICSWQLGVCKPDPVAFERAARRLGAGMAEMLLLDDDQANVAVAESLGWNAEHVTTSVAAVAAIRRWCG